MTIYSLAGTEVSPSQQTVTRSILKMIMSLLNKYISLLILLDRQARLVRLTRLGVSWNFHKNSQSSVTGSAGHVRRSKFGM